MWRFLAVLSVVTIIPLTQGCEPSPSKKTTETPEVKKEETGPSRPTPEPPPPAPAQIQNFSYDPAPFLEAGQDSVPVRLHWQTNISGCQLLLGDQAIDVSSVSSVTVNIPETMDVRLRCGAAEALVNIPLQKKLSIVSLTVESSEDGERIRWDAFGAASCRLQDETNGLDLKDQVPSGEHTVKAALSPLDIQLSCDDGRGQVALSRYNVLEKIKTGSALQIESFSGPSAPLRKLAAANAVAAELQWKTINAVACQLTYGNTTVDVPASGTQTIQAEAGAVFLECHGPRFQTARKSLSIQTRPALELVKFTAPDGFYGSRIFSPNTLALQVFGADSCEMKADNADARYLRRISSTEDLARGAEYRLSANVDTKSILLSCQNSYGEKLTEEMKVQVLPRVEIYKFAADVMTVKSKWSDEAKRPITLSWDVDNFESCEIKKLSVADWIPVHRLEANASQGQVTVEINRATDFSMECRDQNKLLAYKKLEIKWEKEPEQSLDLLGQELAVKGFGFESCGIESPELHYAAKLKADSRFVIDAKETISLLMQQATFTMTCTGPHGPQSIQTYTFKPKNEYFVLRQATYTGHELQFEAAWKMGGEARSCSLYRQENEHEVLVSSDLPKQGTQALRMPMRSDETVTLKIVCGEGQSAVARTSKLEAPAALCENNKHFEPIAQIYSDDLKLSDEEAKTMPCLELVERLGDITKINSRDFLGIPSFHPYIKNVRDISVQYAQDSEELLYFGNARNLTIDSTAFQVDWTKTSLIYTLQALTALESMDLTLNGTQSVDLRYLAASHPHLKSLRVLGTGWYAVFLGLNLQEGLRGLKLKKLELTDLALAEENLSAVLDLPLESLTLANVYCYQSMPAVGADGKDCLATVPATKKMTLKHLGADFASIRNLEALTDLSRVESLYYRELARNEFAWVKRSQPTWNAYEGLTRLELDNVSSLEILKASEMTRVKNLGLYFKKQDRFSSLAALKDKFPALMELSLKNAKVASLFGLWDVPALDTLSLENTKIEEWDLPLDGYRLKTFILNRDQSANFPQGLKIGRMVLNRDDLPELDAGVVDVLEFKTMPYLFGSMKLEALYGKVKTMILNEQRAERLRDSVKNCQLRRETQGTLLVYPPFDALWQACEAL